RFRDHLLRVLSPQAIPFFHAPAFGKVAVDRIVRRGLIGQSIGLDAELEQSGQHFASIPLKSYGNGAAATPRLLQQAESLLQRGRASIEISCLQTLGNP